MIKKRLLERLVVFGVSLGSLFIGNNVYASDVNTPKDKSEFYEMNLPQSWFNNRYDFLQNHLIETEEMRLERYELIGKHIHAQFEQNEILQDSMECAISEVHNKIVGRHKKEKDWKELLDGHPKNKDYRKGLSLDELGLGKLVYPPKGKQKTPSYMI